MHTKNDQSYFGITAAIGSKYIAVRPQKDLFITLAISRNTRYQRHTLNYGASFKYIRVTYWNDIGWTVSDSEFEDYAYGAFFGFEWHLLDYLIVQPRLSYTRSFNPLTKPAPWFNLEQNYYSAIGLGVSILSKLMTNK